MYGLEVVDCGGVGLYVDFGKFCLCVVDGFGCWCFGVVFGIVVVVFDCVLFVVFVGGGVFVDCLVVVGLV